MASTPVDSFTDSYADSTADRYGRVLWYVIVAVLAAAWLLPCVPVLAGFCDEGMSVTNAARVLDGDLPAHDFVEVVGPGEFYWIALFFKLFGTNILTAHMELLLAGVTLSLVAFHLARRAGADPVLACALITVVSIPLFAINSHHWDSDVFALLAFTALIEWQVRKRAVLLAVAGAMAGAATLIMQQKGVLVLGGLVASAALADRANWKRSAAGILVPYGAILGAVGIFYAAHGALGDLLWANLIWPISRYSEVCRCPYGQLLWRGLSNTAGAFRSLMPGLVAMPLAVFAWLPILAIAALPGLLAGAVGILRKKAFPARLTPYWICGAALYFSEWQRPDIYHLVFGCPILLITALALYGMLPAAAWRWPARMAPASTAWRWPARMAPASAAWRWPARMAPASTAWRWPARMAPASAAWRWPARMALASVAIFGFTHMLVFLYGNEKVETRRGTVYARREGVAPRLVERYAQAGENVFVYPYRPLVNFLSATRNPTRFSYFIYGWQTRQQFEEAIGELEAKRVRYVLVDADFAAHEMVTVLPDYQAPPADEQIMERYLASHYREVASEDGFRMLERIAK